MSKVIDFCIYILGITVLLILFINIFNFGKDVLDARSYHYAVIDQVEASNFNSALINEASRNSKYKTSFVSKKSYEDMNIYEVTTRFKVSIPIFNYESTQTLTSTAR